MAVELNHHIIHARDPAASAQFLVELLGLQAPRRVYSFMAVETANGVSLDYMRHDGDISPNHYAFLVTEDEFDAIFGRIQARGLDYYADPGIQQKGEINHRYGGRGVYWQDPDGHLLEIITQPYGEG
jgi:catechol 2,3-dioxygenase-like lactoylglutathione lyase family enzyme